MDSTTVSCNYTECTEETYLPHTCPHCNKKFCDKHESQDNHKCPFLNVSKLRTTVCPLCNEVLRVEAGESLDHAVNTHLDTGKCSTNNSNVPKQSTASSLLFGFGETKTTTTPSSSPTTTNNFCSSCNTYEPVPIICDHCKKNFCLKHKLPESHNCSKLDQIRAHNNNNSNLSKANNQQQQQNQNNNILQGSVVPSSKQKERNLNDILFQVSNTAETAFGVRPGRNITAGDILVLVMYDSSKLKRPNLKPVLFSVSPLTPIGRLLDAAIDNYPGIQKTLKFTIYSSVSLTNNQQGNNNLRRHRIFNENMNMGDVFAEAAAVGGVYPEGAMENFYSPVDNRVILAFCISVDDGSNNHNSNETMMTRSDTEGAFAGAAGGGGHSKTNNNNDFQDAPLETRACVMRPFKDAKGVTLPILVDREHLKNSASASALSAKKGGTNGKKDDKCLVQ